MISTVSITITNFDLLLATQAADWLRETLGSSGRFWTWEFDWPSDRHKVHFVRASDATAFKLKWCDTAEIKHDA